MVLNRSRYCWIGLLVFIGVSPLMAGERLQSASSAGNSHELEVKLQALDKRLSHLESLSPQLDCVDGPEVLGNHDKWSPDSKCLNGYQAVGLAKLDLLGDHKIATLHVNDFRCTGQSCRAYCFGNGCRLKARCCRVVHR